MAAQTRKGASPESSISQKGSVKNFCSSEHIGGYDYFIIIILFSTVIYRGPTGLGVTGVHIPGQEGDENVERGYQGNYGQIFEEMTRKEVI
jgi:hypothetical protein